MTYKKSRFNFSYERDDGSFVIYNTYSKALLLLESTEFAQYDSLQIDDVNIEHSMLENGILLEDTFDEIGFLKYCHNLTKYSNEALHLVLAPTMDCNFACPYCYENRRKGNMGKDIQDAIVHFIEEKIKKGTQTLDVTWYGGEPLLYPDIVQNLSSRIRQVTVASNCDLKMYMVTNGFLLSTELVEMIDRIGVIKVQITLDGLADYHNARRHLRNGRGTFARIIENLKLFDEYSIRVDIRMNVDNENCKDYIGLQKVIAELGNPNITLYPSPVEDINPDTVNEVSNFMTFDEFEAFVGGMCKDEDASSAVTKVLDDRYCYCQAETENSFVIDELGNCYKCWDQAGRIETSCFNITNIKDKNYPNILKFLARDPFADKKCGKCVFLPVCFGGCVFHFTNTGEYDCGFTDESMKRYLEGAFFKN